MDYIIYSLYKRILVWREEGEHINERVRLLRGKGHLTSHLSPEEIRTRVEMSDYSDAKKRDRR